VRRAIELWQPLLGLHGHIHEVSAKERINETVCFNPGSDYRTGHLQGVFLQISQAGKLEADIITQERDPRHGRRKPLSWLEALLAMLPVVGDLFEAYQRAAHMREIQDTIRQLQLSIDALSEKVENLPHQDASQGTNNHSSIGGDSHE
jgi:hypothetical protein